jgi:hypothetical protein
VLRTVWITQVSVFLLFFCFWRSEFSGVSFPLDFERVIIWLDYYKLALSLKIINKGSSQKMPMIFLKWCLYRHTYLFYNQSEIQLRYVAATIFRRHWICSEVGSNVVPHTSVGTWWNALAIPNLSPQLLATSQPSRCCLRLVVMLRNEYLWMETNTKVGLSKKAKWQFPRPPKSVRKLKAENSLLQKQKNNKNTETWMIQTVRVRNL